MIYLNPEVNIDLFRSSEIFQYSIDMQEGIPVYLSPFSKDLDVEGTQNSINKFLMFGLQKVNLSFEHFYWNSFFSIS